MKLMYVTPKSKVETLRTRPTPHEDRPREFYMRNVQARIIDGKGDTYSLMKVGDDTKVEI